MTIPIIVTNVSTKNTGLNLNHITHKNHEIFRAQKYPPCFHPQHSIWHAWLEPSTAQRMQSVNLIMNSNFALSSSLCLSLFSCTASKSSTFEEEDAAGKKERRGEKKLLMRSLPAIPSPSICYNANCLMLIHTASSIDDDGAMTR